MPIEITRPVNGETDGDEEQLAREITEELIKSARVSARAEAVVEEWDEWLRVAQQEVEPQHLVPLLHAVDRLKRELRS